MQKQELFHFISIGLLFLVFIAMGVPFLSFPGLSNLGNLYNFAFGQSFKVMVEGSEEGIISCAFNVWALIPFIAIFVLFFFKLFVLKRNSYFAKLYVYKSIEIVLDLVILVSIYMAYGKVSGNLTIVSTQISYPFNYQNVNVYVGFIMLMAIYGLVLLCDVLSMIFEGVENNNENQF